MEIYIKLLSKGEDFEIVFLSHDLYNLTNWQKPCAFSFCHDHDVCAIVSEDMVFSLRLSEEDTSKYTTYLVRSYVEQNKRVKWCPTPNCVEVDSTSNATQEVVCNCSHKFCWDCLEEAHHPIGCNIVKNGLIKLVMVIHFAHIEYFVIPSPVQGINDQYRKIKGVCTSWIFSSHPMINTNVCLQALLAASSQT